MKTDKLNFATILRRTVEIDFMYKHRHLTAGTLSALPIMIDIFNSMNEGDTFILSKGHACAALYACLEAQGFHPDVSRVHPERDPANGIMITSGSLGHGLPIAAGIAYAEKLTDEPGRIRKVHVLMGDGECMEGTTWETVILAIRLNLQSRLAIHIDCNGYQGSDEILDRCAERLNRIYGNMTLHYFNSSWGIASLDKFAGSTHLITPEEFKQIMEDLK